MRTPILVLFSLLLTGCGTARTIVLQPNVTAQRFPTVSVVSHNPTVDVPADIQSSFEAAIDAGLYDEGPFELGSDLEVRYTFMSHDPGSRLTRWVFDGAGNAGEGSMLVQVSYVARDGSELARTQVEGRIGSGVLGGSIHDALARVAEDIVKFTIEQFAQGR